MASTGISDSNAAMASGLAICLMEAVQATITGADDADVVVDRYSSYRQAQGQRADVDGVRALLRTFEEAGGIDPWAGKVGNYRRRYSPQSPPVAAGAIEHAAELFYAHRIDSVDDLRDALHTSRVRSELEAGLRAIAERSDTWDTLLGLTGLEAQLSTARA